MSKHERKTNRSSIKKRRKRDRFLLSRSPHAVQIKKSLLISAFCIPSRKKVFRSGFEPNILSLLTPFPFFHLCGGGFFPFSILFMSRHDPLPLPTGFFFRRLGEVKEGHFPKFDTLLSHQGALKSVSDFFCCVAWRIPR